MLGLALLPKKKPPVPGASGPLHTSAERQLARNSSCSSANGHRLAINCGRLTANGLHLIFDTLLDTLGSFGLDLLILWEFYGA